MNKTITPRGNSWEATVRHQSLPSGRLRRSFRCKYTAEAWASQALADVLNGKPVDLRRLKAPARGKTLEEGIAHVLKYRWSGTKSEQSHLLNTHALIDFFGATAKLEDITEDRVEDFTLHLREQGKADGTINRKLSCLSVILRAAYKRGWIATRPEIGRRKEKLTRISYYSKTEQQEITKCFNSMGLHRYAALFGFLCDTGLRISEALRLNYSDIRPIDGGDDKSRPAIYVYESKHSDSPPRAIPLTNRAFRAVYPQSESTPSLLDGMAGPFSDLTKRSSRSAWDRLRKALCKQGQPDFVWHTCRHTFCSLLVQAGESLAVVKELAGHKDISTTLRYAHLSPQNKLSAIDKLEAWTK